MGMLGDETDDKTMSGVLQKRVSFLSSADIVWGLRVLVCVTVGAFVFLLGEVQKDAAGVGSVRSCSSVLSGVGLPD